MRSTASERRAEVTLRLAEFDFPPMQDVLLVGRRAPIGPEAARRMVDVLSPDQYEVLPLDHEVIEAVVVRKSLLRLVPADKLLPFLVEEGGRVADASAIIKAQVTVTIEVSRTVEL
ncbi:MAG: hypothetical protein ACPLRW_02260 [Moorellales bacterium]